MNLTCRQAAAQMREWAAQTPYQATEERLVGQAEILDHFGDQPCPPSLVDSYRFEEPEPTS